MDKNIVDFLETILSATDGISDLNMSVGKPPQIEVNGKLQSTEFRKSAFTPADTERIAKELMEGREDLAATLAATGSCDCALGLPSGIRTRVNIFKVKGAHAIVMRLLPTSIPTYEDLNLPPILAEIPKLKSGLALVTGPTGSGKSTTMAAIIDRINSTRPVHIVTLEDPVEFMHPHKMGIINQREQGTDFTEFNHGLKAALRQGPKVIFVGEIRDRETVEITLKAAETGHLVLSTLHTIDAGQTVNRMVGMFPAEDEALVRYRLSQTLRFVVGQRLLPKAGGGRVAAQEIMSTDLRVQELIREGETPDKTFYSVIQEASAKGWQTFDQHITSMLAQDLITEEVASAYSSNASVMNKAMDKIKASQGKSTSDLGDLEMKEKRPDPRESRNMDPREIMGRGPGARRRKN